MTDLLPIVALSLKTALAATLLILPPGGFIVLGFLLALKAAIEARPARTGTIDEAHERIQQVFTAGALLPGAGQRGEGT